MIRTVLGRTPARRTLNALIVLFIIVNVLLTVTEVLH